MEKKLEVKNLQISFRTNNGNVKAVRNISFDLMKGETLAIVGESGSGKSVTSKAIIGILSGNSIIEGGEILYDGQDLLKISEEDFHKIRGDKISMIFQDPLSSLDPIVKIGQQMTEAMILKGKTSQKNARKLFNTKLALLNKAIDEVNPENKEYNANECKTFNSFCVIGTKLELEYNNAHAAAVAIDVDSNDIIFLIEKHQKVDAKKYLKDLKKNLALAEHPFVYTKDEEVENELNALLENKDRTDEEVVKFFKKVNEMIDVVLKKDKPNYFRLAYYVYRNPEYKYDGEDIKELDQKNLEYLDKEFMANFLQLGSFGVEKSHKDSINKKQELLADIDKEIEFFGLEGLENKEKESNERVKALSKKVNDAIDYLSVHKNSTEYSFEAAFKSFVAKYYNGIKENPKAMKRYERQTVKFNKLVESGKDITWKVIPPMLTDLELAQKNIVKLLNTLKSSYQNDINNESKYDKMENIVSLVDFLKEQASLFVYTVTHQIAKARALELMEEVGIPEPVIRYNQYPFEFSGGMRQRIVIAIALSANPDILICDEPTTALDVTIQSQILELINRIKNEHNLSVIFITHDLGVVANMADRIAVMYAGKIVEYGTCEDVFYDPKHPYTWALLSSMPDLDTKEKLEAIPGTPPNMIYPPKGDAFAERNKYALEIDYEMEPPMFEVSETHYAATWLLHEDAPKVEPPKIVTERIKRMKKEVEENGD